MGIDDRIFAKEKITKLLIRFAIPAIISLLVQELYNMVDTVFAGRFIGASAIGALTVAFPIQRLLISLGLLIAVGGSTYVSINLGKGDREQVKKSIGASVLLGAIMLIAVSIICGAALRPFLYGLGASKVTYPIAHKYVSIILIGGVFQALTSITCYIMTVLGDTRVTLYANSIGAVLNIIIDGILMAFLGFGIEGAAIATVVSQFIAFGFAMFKFRRVLKFFEIKLSLETLARSFNLSIMSGIVVTGFSSFIIEISDALSSTVLNNLLLLKGGDNAVIMLGTVTKVSMFMYITIIGISSAMQPIVAYNYGAGNIKRVRSTVKTTIKSVLLTSVIMQMVLMIFAEPVIGFFLKDKVLLLEAVKAFRIAIFMVPLAGICYVSVYFFQSTDEPKKSMMISLNRMIIMFIPISAVLTIAFGIMGTWISYPICDFAAAIIGAYTMRGILKGECEAREEKKITAKIPTRLVPVRE